MNSIYHRRGHLRSILGPFWHHLQRTLRDPAYRALHKFHRQIGRRPRYQHGTVRFSGNDIDFCDNASFLSAWDEIFVNRIYDIGDAANPLLIDVGANIGLAAAFWKTRYRSFRYLGFEPDPAIAAICRANLESWGVRGELKESAIGQTEGRARFVSDGADAGHLASEAADDTHLVVGLERLSKYLHGPVDLLKIDVEGAEMDVISEARKELHHVKRIFVEWHCDFRSESSLGSGISLLESEGFNVIVQVAGGPPAPYQLGRTDGDGCQHLNLFGVRS